MSNIEANVHMRWSDLYETFEQFTNYTVTTGYSDSMYTLKCPDTCLAILKSNSTSKKKTKIKKSRMKKEIYYSSAIRKET